MINLKIYSRKEIFNIVGKQAKVIVEIGACDGSDTNRMLNAFPQAKIYSAEPKPDNIKLWHENVNSFRASLRESAISDVDDSVDLYCSNDKYIGASSIRQPTQLLMDKFKDKGLTFTHKIKVPSMTLDFMCTINLIEGIDLLWIDTQGAEGDIIMGGKEILKNTKYLFIEYSLVECYKGQILVEEMIEMLSGFKLLGKFQNNLFMKRR